MNITFFIKEFHLRHPVIKEIKSALIKKGVNLDFVVLKETILDLQSLGNLKLASNSDLVVFKTTKYFAEHLAILMEQEGLRVINGSKSIRLNRDKILNNITLRKSGIKTPKTIAFHSSEIKKISQKMFPMVIKPVVGGRARGVKLVSNKSELEKNEKNDDIVIGQKYIENDGLDRKLYVVDDKVFGIFKPSVLTPSDNSNAFKEFKVEEDLKEIALKCGEITNSKIYGVDVILGEDGPYVIETNDFPGFRGIKNAGKIIADFLYLKKKEKR
ncbi:MAG: RimK family alpha-L-glutamate ligase [Methanosarcinales archaeon]